MSNALRKVRVPQSNRPDSELEMYLKAAVPPQPRVSKGKPSPRPKVYSPELGDLLCYYVATSVKGLKAVCDAHPELPYSSTARDWMIAYPEFGSAYLRAREMRAELLVDQAIEIADDMSRDLIRRVDGSIEAQNHVGIGRDRLRVTTRQWVAGKLHQGLWGDKQTVDIKATLTLAHLVLAAIDKPAMLDVTPASTDDGKPED